MVDPVILFFVLGVAAGLMRADLRLPAPVYEFLSFLLLLAIGLKGGVELANQSPLALLPQIVVIGLMGTLMPFIAFPVLRFLGRMNRADSASIAAHYGSVSVGTFAVAVAYLNFREISFEEYMPLFVVVLEVPAIIIGIMLARGVSRDTAWGRMAHEVFLGKSIVLLVGGLLIGWALGAEGVEPIAPMFFDLFKGVLALFLLEMGLIAAAQISVLRRHGVFLVAFGIGMPLVGAVIGTGVSLLLGLSLGGTVIVATLAASASYIAVPAAFRLIVPEANPTLSLTASLGVTFPFNVIAGIPIYHAMAGVVHGPGGVF
ncbi:putative sodium-dependent bicarbonate transporter [Caenispirillum salinarum AK4]|uniref:Putative sodium-dependent bicarbonate transporter n=1 Tax=Caenispirillum salinarum AK4 TaxID=1238182 RepID=K9HVL4_9PROT|nr:sodium-dependent bicarbonate transport family permease [Caenispirillum salinarum]EKV32271.1 putative sodium-dependent bicarbonate transporter [Caenispirillum salinarum AK4]